MSRLLIICCLSTVVLGASLPNASLLRKEIARRNTRLVGGLPINITEVPYQVALEFFALQYCAGTIISPTFILSAAHCVTGFQPGEVTVRYGSDIREGFGTIIKAIRLIKHSNYSESTNDYDVSLIELKTPIVYSESAQPIKITESEPAGESQVKITGWGQIGEEDEDEPSEQLLFVDVPVVDRKICADDYKLTGPITDRMICAGLGGHAPCYGDSGGPVVQNGTVLGVVSWGVGCAREGYPGVNANLANNEIRQFIRDIANV